MRRPPRRPAPPGTAPGPRRAPPSSLTGRSPAPSRLSSPSRPLPSRRLSRLPDSTRASPHRPRSRPPSLHLCARHRTCRATPGRAPTKYARIPIPQRKDEYNGVARQAVGTPARFRGSDKLRKREVPTVKIRLLSIVGALALTTTAAVGPVAAAGDERHDEPAHGDVRVDAGQLGTSAPAQFGPTDYPGAPGAWGGAAWNNSIAPGWGGFPAQTDMGSAQSRRRPRPRLVLVLGQLIGLFVGQRRARWAPPPQVGRLGLGHGHGSWDGGPTGSPWPWWAGMPLSQISARDGWLVAVGLRPAAVPPPARAADRVRAVQQQFRWQQHRAAQRASHLSWPAERPGRGRRGPERLRLRWPGDFGVGGGVNGGVNGFGFGLGFR